MAEAEIRGVRIVYEVIGSSGPWIALTPGARRAHDELIPLARRLAEGGARVLLHDRRNCGRSEVGIQDLGSEHEIWADDLATLADKLGTGPIWAGGASAGARLALLLALRHPKAVKGLLLWRVTGGNTAANHLAEQYYGSYMKLAEADGMKAVCDSEHFRGLIAARPTNRDRLMAMDPARFIAIMQAWRERFLAAAELPVIGATEADLAQMRMPVCLIAGNDRIHTPATARNMASLIPGAELHDDVVSRRPENDLLHDWSQEEWRSVEPRIAQIFADFMQRHTAP